MTETTFTPDGNGNVVKKQNLYDNDIDNSMEKRLSCTLETVYNPNGIEMRCEYRKYKGGQDILHVITTRDKQYPFIANKRTIVNNCKYGDPAGTIKHMLIENERLGSLDQWKYEWEYKMVNGKNGIPTPKQIAFDSRKQMLKYFQENKEAIQVAFMQKQYCIYFANSQRLTEAWTKGVWELAVGAGILPSENTHEK